MLLSGTLEACEHAKDGYAAMSSGVCGVCREFKSSRACNMCRVGGVKRATCCGASDRTVLFLRVSLLQIQRIGMPVDQSSFSSASALSVSQSPLGWPLVGSSVGSVA